MEPCIAYEELFVFAHRFKPKRYLEIGAKSGEACKRVANGCQTTELCVIDWPDHGYGGAPNSELILQDTLEAIAYNRHKIHLGDSHASAALKFIEDNAPYELVFIDGDHSFLGALLDVCHVYPYLSETGTLLLHDVFHLAHTRDLMRVLSTVRHMFSTIRLSTEDVGVAVMMGKADLLSV